MSTFRSLARKIGITAEAALERFSTPVPTPPSRRARPGRGVQARRSRLGRGGNPARHYSRRWCVIRRQG